MMPRRVLRGLIRCSIYVIALIVILNMLSGCTTNLPASNFCLIYKPVYTSDQDTQWTIDQVVLNNAVWVELCE